MQDKLFLPHPHYYKTQSLYSHQYQFPVLFHLFVWLMGLMAEAHSLIIFVLVNIVSNCGTITLSVFFFLLIFYFYLATYCGLFTPSYFYPLLTLIINRCWLMQLQDKILASTRVWSYTEDMPSFIGNCHIDLWNCIQL